MVISSKKTHFKLTYKTTYHSFYHKMLGIKQSQENNFNILNKLVSLMDLFLLQNINQVILTHFCRQKGGSWAKLLFHY